MDNNFTSLQPMTTSTSPDDITAVILAGGRGSRMGGQDKGWIKLDETPLIKHIVQAITPQVGSIIISANRHLDRYATFGYPVVGDTLVGFQGPLAGVLAAMEQAHTPYILTLPCDAPGVPPSLASRLGAAAGGSHVAVAHDGQHLQAVYALIPVALAPDLRQYLHRGERKMRQWLSSRGMQLVDFSDSAHAFRNINTPEDLAALKASTN
ncbi:MAG: molybdenum cofactor guanylyltransferase MobA [bacterium]